MSGFQSYNTVTGTYQVDGVFKNYVLVRVVDILCQTELVNGYLPVKVGRTAISQGEIAALSSAYPCAVASVSSGILEVHTQYEQASTARAVRVYFFAPISTSDAKSGLQVFHEVTGELLFCASKKPIRMVQVVSGHVDTILDMSRTYATVLLNQYYALTTSGFQQNGANRTVNADRSMISPLTSGIRISLVKEILWAGPTQDNTYYQPPSIASSSVDVAKHLIIDVTGYV